MKDPKMLGANVKNTEISEEKMKNPEISEAKYRIIEERKRSSNPEILEWYETNPEISAKEMGNPEISERKIANPVIPPTYNTPPLSDYGSMERLFSSVLPLLPLWNVSQVLAHFKVLGRIGLSFL